MRLLSRGVECHDLPAPEQEREQQEQTYSDETARLAADDRNVGTKCGKAKQRNRKPDGAVNTTKSWFVVRVMCMSVNMARIASDLSNPFVIRHIDGHGTGDTPAAYF
jgi:hypothetical protein